MENNKDCITKYEKRPKNPRETANILSKILFLWTIPTFQKGAKKDLDEEDLYRPLKDHESKFLGDKLETVWFHEEKNHVNPSLLRAIVKVFTVDLLLSGILIFFLEFVIRITMPLLIGKLVDYYRPYQTELSLKDAYLFAGGIVLVSLSNVLLVHPYMLHQMNLGMKMRIACSSLIYRKTLRLSKKALAKTTIGQMVNLLSNDVKRFDYAMLHTQHIWVAPLLTIIISYLLYSKFGLTAVAGILIMIIIVPMQMFIAKMASVYRLRTAVKTDERVRLMSEIISGIQVLKMYTWEKPFAKLVELSRKLEINQIRASSYLRATILSFMMFVNRTAVYLCILSYVLLGNKVSAEYVFVLIGFYNVLRQSMTMNFPRAITTLAETKISINRITTFLLYDEIPNDDRLHKGQERSVKSILHRHISRMDSSKVGVSIKNGTAKWVESSHENTLTNINMILNYKHLVAVVGPVGSGKTSLLHVILKELPLIKGNIEVGGTISYASQESWLFAGTIKQNILFGQPLNERKYQEVVRVCALVRDFTLFPYGDNTLIGDRGVTLSGGQKARINLARAVYKEADIYLLDDPLSAVDTHVGKQLFDDCIVGYLKEKCIVLVTHQLQYLQNVEKLFLLEKGEIITQGSYRELQKSGDDFTKLLQTLPSEDEHKNNKGDTKESTDEDNKKKNGVPTEVKESKGAGKISGRIYTNYLRSGGSICRIAVVFILIIISQLLGSLVDYFITYWVNLEQSKTEWALKMNRTQINITSISNKTVPVLEKLYASWEEDFFTTENCLYIYSTGILLIIVLSLARSLNFYAFCVKASKVLHNNMFNKIVYAPMRFFNTNQSGRILNRFSKDMGTIDENLPEVILDTIQIGLGVFAITGLVGAITPWILIPTGIILVAFYWLKVFYLKTSRNIKRLEGITKSPVFSHINASLQGLTTIRAFGAQEALKIEFDNHQDLHSSAYFMFSGCTRTFGLWLDLICVVYISFVTLGFLVIGSETYGGNVGLSITQSISLLGMFQWGMRQWSELENQMTSVERVIEYTEIEPEKESKTREPPKNWPEHGKLEFRSVSMRYAETEPYVLKNLNFKVKPREKVGIVGRTGAGKSSLITALFRLVNIEGEILIDDISTKDLSLHETRSKISIIPQEPVLFSGTLRKNLDPFEEHNDDKLWSALEMVELKTEIYDLPAGLRSKISEGGSNFSVGQRQLICLARAILRNNRILVLDEATANVDPMTDALIQTTIRKQFTDCTVLTIAHRLHTIMDSDKVLIMDDGNSVEYDHPFVLLQDPDSIFYDLVKQTGKTMADNLMQVAQLNFEKSKNT